MCPPGLGPCSQELSRTGLGWSQLQPDPWMALEPTCPQSWPHPGARPQHHGVIGSPASVSCWSVRGRVQVGSIWDPSSRY